MRVQDIMSTSVEAVAREAGAAEAWERMRRRGIHHLVVLDEGRVVGVLSDRDLGGPRGGALRDGRRVGDLMSGQVVAVEPETTVRQAANRMRGRSIGCLPVVENGKLRGIVTVSDLLALLGSGVERPVERGKRWTLRHRGPARSRHHHANG